jgi:hypothetical protein
MYIISPRDQLIIPSDLSSYKKASGNWALRCLSKLENSGLFSVKKEGFPDLDIKEIIGKRHDAIIFFKINEILCAIDVWDGLQPTCMLIDWFLNHPFYSKTKVIFKIQHRPNFGVSQIDLFTERTGIKVSNWTMFHSATFPLEYFEWDKNKNHRFLTYISGRRRREWLDMYHDSNEVATFENVDLQKVPKNRPKLTSDNYFEILKEIRWQMSLKGKRISSLDCKNRREVEGASVGLPLALNYIPEYPFPFEKDVHYVYIEKPEDLLNLRDIDPVPYHEASVETYEQYFSDQGSAKILMGILEEI